MNQPSSIRRTLVVLSIILVAMLARASAATYTVNTIAESGPGSLRDAITQANANPGADTINFDPALTAASPATISLTSALPTITDSATITGPGKDKLTVKNGLVDPLDPFGILVDPNNPTYNPASAFRVFTIAVDGPGVVSLSGVTVTNGFAVDIVTIGRMGGGILNYGTGTLNVTDSAITKNTAEYYGGGIANYQAGTLNITRCTISGNGKIVNWSGTPGGVVLPFTNFGGGISNGVLGDVAPRNIIGGTVRVVDSVISDNAGSGGGIGSPAGGAIILINSTVTGNTGKWVGAGGISAAFGAIVSILNSTISDNQTGPYSKSAGGLSLDHSTADITNSTINGNIDNLDGGSSASIAAGGIYLIASVLNLTNCTITNNQAATLIEGEPNGPYGVSAGAIASDVASNGDESTLSIFNCTISGNSSDNGPGGILNRGQPATGAVGVVNIRSSIVAGNISSPVHYPPTGARIFAINSQGYNIVGTNELTPMNTVSGDQTGVTGVQLNLGPLANNGGPTQTMALGLGSVAINHGFADVSLLPNDQRGSGFARVVGSAADVGAFEVQNHAPIARAKNVTVPAGSNCQASVTPQQVNDGSFDPDVGDVITLSLSPSGPFAIGTHNVTLTATDSSGFSSTATAVVTVVDNTPPVITSVTAPAPGQTNSSNCQAPVPNVLPGVHFTDCSVVTLTQSPVAGTLVGIGQKVITITARDSANNIRTATTTFTVTAGPPTFTVSVNPGTVRQGGTVTLTTAYSNCASTAQTVSLKISLTGPNGRTAMLTLPLTIPGNRSGSLSVPLVIPRSTPVGSYSLTLDVFVGNTQVGTSSAQLTVTHY